MEGVTCQARVLLIRCIFISYFCFLPCSYYNFVSILVIILKIWKTSRIFSFIYIITYFCIRGGLQQCFIQHLIFFLHVSEFRRWSHVYFDWMSIVQSFDWITFKQWIIDWQDSKVHCVNGSLASGILFWNVKYCL